MKEKKRGIGYLRKLGRKQEFNNDLKLDCLVNNKLHWERETTSKIVAPNLKFSCAVGSISASTAPHPPPLPPLLSLHDGKGKKRQKTKQSMIKLLNSFTLSILDSYGLLLITDIRHFSPNLKSVICNSNSNETKYIKLMNQSLKLHSTRKYTLWKTFWIITVLFYCLPW